MAAGSDAITNGGETEKILSISRTQWFRRTGRSPVCSDSRGRIKRWPPPWSVSIYFASKRNQSETEWGRNGKDSEHLRDAVVSAYREVARLLRFERADQTLAASLVGLDLLCLQAKSERNGMGAKRKFACRPGARDNEWGRNGKDSEHLRDAVVSAYREVARLL